MKRSLSEFTIDFGEEVDKLAIDSSEGAAGSYVPDSIGTNSGPLVGEVANTASPEFPGRVLVRWQAADGRLQETWLLVVRGLALAVGDHVLLQQPANWPDLLVTNAISAGQPSSVPASNVPATGATHFDARVDGSRIEIEGKEEVVLRCGKASITLTRAGKVLIRGAYILNRSSGVNRIKGGSVQIN